MATIALPIPRPIELTTLPESETFAAVAKHGPAPAEHAAGVCVALNCKPVERDDVFDENCVKSVPEMADCTPTVADEPEAFAPAPVWA